MAIKNSVAKVMRYLKKNGFGNTVYALIERVFFAYNKNYTYQEPEKAILECQKNTQFTDDILISIVVPTYETKEIHLREMIESVLCQTYEKFELILVDASTTAAVKDVVKTYEDARIVYHKLAKNAKHFGGELAVNQEIEVMVIENNPETRRIRLGVKQLTENPWEKFAKEHKAGSTLEGEVVSITDFGVFVKAAEGIEGLVNKSNLCESREESFEDAVKKYNVGDKINVFVVDVNVSKQKVAFSVKEYKQKLQRDEISQYMSSSNNGDDEAYTPFGDLLKTKN